MGNKPEFVDLISAATRQLAEQVVAVLNDAPLTFLDGVLVYFRRSDRRFPTMRTQGVQANVA